MLMERWLWIENRSGFFLFEMSAQFQKFQSALAPKMIEKTAKYGQECNIGACLPENCACRKATYGSAITLLSSIGKRSAHLQAESAAAMNGLKNIGDLTGSQFAYGARVGVTWLASYNLGKAVGRGNLAGFDPKAGAASH